MTVSMSVGCNARKRGGVALAALAAVLGTSAPASAADLVLTAREGSDELQVQGTIPVSGGVEVQLVPPRGVTLAAADIFVWPAARARCDVPEPPSGLSSPQTYAIPLTIAEASGHSAGTATLPHLQTNATFCFRTVWRAHVVPSATEVAASSRRLLDDLRDQASPNEAEFGRTAQAIIVAACTAPSGRCVTVDPHPLARTLWERYLASGLRDHERRRQGSHDALDRAQVEIDTAIEQARRLPALRVNDELTLNLRWAEEADAAKVAQALTALPHGTRSRRWQAWLTTARPAFETLDRHNTSLVELEGPDGHGGLIGIARTTLRASFETATAEYLNERLYYERGGRATARARSASAANYVSPEAGIALGGSPLGGVWALLYAGLNIYFAPVEREIPLGDLVGSDWDIFAQYFSLTIAYAGNTAPAISGGTVEGAFGDGLPGVGFGVRLAQFVRVSALSFFYYARPNSPLSQERLLSVALCASLSIDADVVALLTKAIGG